MRLNRRLVANSKAQFGFSKGRRQGALGWEERGQEGYWPQLADICVNLTDVAEADALNARPLKSICKAQMPRNGRSNAATHEGPGVALFNKEIERTRR